MTMELDHSEEAGPSSPRVVANGSQPGKAHAWTYTPVYTLQGHTRSISALAISPDGKELVSSGADGLLKVWSIATGSLLVTLDYAEAERQEAAADREEQRRINGTNGKAGKAGDELYSTPKGRLLGINDVTWSSDGGYLVAGGDDKVVRVWDVKRRKIVRHLRGHTSFVFCVAFSPDGTLVFSGSFDESVRLWDIRRGTCHRTIAAHSDTVTGVACNRDGSILASCSYDGLIRLWDAPTGQCLKTLVHGGETTPIGHVTFSPNGFQLLATSLDGTIRLWDMANARVLKTYTGHQNTRFAMKAGFTAWATRQAVDGLPENETRDSPPCMIVAGSEDHRVYLWDLQTKAVAQTLFGHRDTVLSVATHDQVPIIASASLDNDISIKVWRASQSV